MTLSRLLVREIQYRKLNFCLGVLAIALAVGCLVSALGLLHRHDRRTDELILAKEAETQVQMAKLEDDYRKITRSLGFNVLILPKEQNLHDLFADDYASKFMPESYVHRLATSKVVTIQHLLPSLQQKIKWPERERTILLIGVRGEVPLLHANPKKPLLDPVAPSTLVLGYELHRSLGLKPGDRTRLMGQEFTVAKCYPERGTKDDITVWMNLPEAQALLQKPGLINGILALECVCTPDSLAKIRAELAAILPETQVIEFASQALTRAEARQRAALEAREAIEREKRHRAILRAEREEFAAILVPVVVVAAAASIAFLALANVRERRVEIGIWRALGMRSRQVLGLFVGRALIVGVLGGFSGYALGAAITLFSGEPLQTHVLPSFLLQPVMWGSILAGAPVLALTASWIPSVSAAGQDPAAILSRE